MLLRVFISTLLAAMPAVSAAEFRVAPGSVIIPVSQADGAAALATPDDFTRVLSEFDRASRMKSGAIPSPEDYLNFVASQALSWNDNEIAKLGPIFESIRSTFAAYHLPLPAKILLIKTTGLEEGGASYCRGPNVVIPKQVAGEPAGELQDTLTHELFHILSKSNPSLRNSLYQIIGFEPCSEVVMPDEIKHRLITNPDAPRPGHYTTVTVGGKEIRVAPVLFSRLQRYDPAAGGSFFNSLTFKFMVIEPVKGAWIPQSRDGKTWLLDARAAGDFMNRIGPDPGPILQPEEILATYFVPLVSAGGKGVPENIAKGMMACFGAEKH